ncbi:MAG: hypothetical protein AB8B71_12260 [Paracoccaceae bacterium]
MTSISPLNPDRMGYDCGHWKGRILQCAIAADSEERLHTLRDVLTSETSITLAQIGKTSLTDH